jgi:hypothetical protein
MGDGKYYLSFPATETKLIQYLKKRRESESDHSGRGGG